ncbi:MAG: ABC transporter permease [Longimicrobiales bacterium]|nr:ABC transporter permease [Longimicrobiales bacterium]
MPESYPPAPAPRTLRGSPAPAPRPARFGSRLGRHPVALAALAVLAGLTAACVFGPWLLPLPPDQVQLDAIRAAPSWAHPLGTDDLGRDILARLLHGGRYSILIGVLAALLGTGIGTLVGGVAGYAGGRVDGALMRATDVAYAIPALPLLIVLASFTGASPASLAVIIGLLSWMTTARVVRGEVLALREAPFVLAARGLGARPARVLGRHILPNALGPIVVGGTLAVGNAIVVESSMSFLGLGVQPPTPTWGNMLMDAQASMAAAPWLTIFPGVAILLVVLAVNFLGDGLQDALDPRGRVR